MGYLTLVDFNLSELAHYTSKMFKDEYSSFKFLQRIKDNFNNLPEIKAYYAKETSVKAPYLPPNFSVVSTEE